MCNFRWTRFNHAKMKFVWQMRKKLFNCERLIADIKLWYSSLICVYVSTQQSSINKNANDEYMWFDIYNVR